jgi:lysophospholipase L1-like esterase
MRLFSWIAVVVLAIWLMFYGIGAWRQFRLNRWPIKNMPIQSGAVVCFGDSLVSGIGADSPEETYPARLGTLIGCEVIADGTPGETTGGALGVLNQGGGPKDAPLVIVTLGGNDMLNRVPLKSTLRNLAGIFKELQSRGSVVAFTIVESPLSGGRGKRLTQLCKKHGVIVVPNLLGGILSRGSLKADPIHPNSDGYAIVAERVAKVVRPFLSQ